MHEICRVIPESYLYLDLQNSHVRDLHESLKALNVWQTHKVEAALINIDILQVLCELPASGNWDFDVQWSPCTPGVLSTSSFDGKIGIYNIEV